MKKATSLIIFILLSISLLHSKELEQVKLRLDWLHQFQFAGYYIAKEKGYFKELGLDVEIKEFKYGINQVDEVINQKVDYAVGKSSLIIDKLNGKNIIALAAIYQNSPMVLLSTNLNIKRPQDLYKKNVMLTADARTAVSINSMITSKGIKLSDINFQEHTFDINDLINKKTDAMGSYVSNEPFILKSKNIKYNILDPKDYGFDFYGGILFTSKFELRHKPQRVQNMQKAVLKGWEYAFSNLDESIEIIMNKYNTQNKSYSALLYEAQTLKKLSGFENNKLGNINYKKLNEIKKIYTLMGYINEDKKLKNFIVFPKDVLLTKKEKEYLSKTTITYLSKINPPFNNGLSYSSIEYDLLNIIKEKTDIDFKIKNIKHTNIATKAIQDNSSQIKAALSNEDMVQKDMVLTKSILDIPYAIATNSSERFISSISMLKNKKVAIQSNSLIISSIQEEFPNIMFIKTKSIEDSLKLLSKNQVDAIIDTLPSLSNQIKKNSFKNIKVSGITKFNHELKYLVNKNNPILLNVLNKIIERINKNKIDEISDKYNKVEYLTNKQDIPYYKISILLLILLLVFVFINFKLLKEMKKRKKIEAKLHEIAHTDELTNLKNRRNMMKILINNISLSKRYDRPLSIVFIDVDNFKQINDIQGHAIGDQVLKDISLLLTKNIRASDSIGRWGGEEFLLILPETSKENAQRTAENLKEIIATSSFSDELKVTCSFGVTSLKKEDTSKTFIKRADEAMYFIKHNGKNGVKVN